MKRIFLSLVCLFLLIGTARAIPPFPPGGTCSSAGCGLTTGSWATYFASTFLPMSGVYTAGHLLGMDATDTYIVDVGAPVTDNSTASHVLIKDSNGYVANAVHLTDVAYLPAAGTGLVEKITATFDYRSAGTPVPVNSIAYVSMPYAVSSINNWEIICSASDATGIIIDVFGVTHTLDTLPTGTYCGSGTKPNVANGHSTSATTPAAWNCSTTSFVANTDLAFKVITAPTTSQLCVITLTVTR